MQHEHHDYHQAGIMASASLYWFGLAVYNAAPPWQLVPPLLFGVAAVWNAWTNHRRAKVTTS